MQQNITITIQPHITLPAPQLQQPLMQSKPLQAPAQPAPNNVNVNINVENAPKEKRTKITRMQEEIKRQQEMPQQVPQMQQMPITQPAKQHGKC